MRIDPSTDRAISRYVSHLETRGLSRSTTVGYRQRLILFFETIGADVDDGPTTERLEDYLAVDCAHYAASTKRTTIATLKGFFRYRHERHGVPDPAAPLRVPPPARRRPTYLTTEQLAAVIRQPEHPRDRVLLTLLARHGQRVGSVIRLRWDEVDFSRAAVDYPLSKRQLRRMPLDSDTARLLKAWRALNASEWVFPSRSGGHVGYDRARQLCKAACKGAGVPWRGCHEFRRSLATALLQQGEPLHKVSRLVLGHADVQTTVRHYAGADDEDVAGMIRRLPF